jgi:hypothetical protein
LLLPRDVTFHAHHFPPKQLVFVIEIPELLHFAHHP